MALAITFSALYDDGTRCQHKRWVQIAHVPFERLKPEARPLDVEQVTADGDELSAVLARFSNLPTPKLSLVTGHSVVTWYGDHAKFIIANIS